MVLFSGQSIYTSPKLVTAPANTFAVHITHSGNWYAPHCWDFWCLRGIQRLDPSGSYWTPRSFLAYLIAEHNIHITCEIRRIEDLCDSTVYKSVSMIVLRGQQSVAASVSVRRFLMQQRIISIEYLERGELSQTGLPPATCTSSRQPTTSHTSPAPHT